MSKDCLFWVQYGDQKYSVDMAGIEYTGDKKYMLRVAGRINRTDSFPFTAKIDPGMTGITLLPNPTASIHDVTIDFTFER